MKPLTSLVTLILGIFTLPGIGLSFGADAVPLQKLLDPLGLSVTDSNTLQVLDHDQRKGTERIFQSILFTTGTARVQIESQEPISQEEAARMTNSEYAVLEGLYLPRKTPYAGEVSQVIDCAEQNKPRIVHSHFLGKPVKVLFAGAGERFSFGVCEKDLIAYWGAFFSLYVPKSQQLLEIRVFVPERAPPERATRQIMDILSHFRARNR